MGQMMPQQASAEEALGCLRSGNPVYIHSGCATPEALAARARELIRIAHPRFRDDLMHWAVRFNYLPARQKALLETAA